MKMKNLEVAKILREIAYFLDMDDVKFKPRAYEKAASSVDALDEDIAEVYRRGGVKSLMEIPGIGQAIAEKIEEMTLTGKSGYHEKLNKKIPVDLESLIAIEGIGPKTIKELYQKLKIKTVEDLEKAAKSSKIAGLSGFGKKKEENILKGIGFFKKSQGRFLLGDILPIIKDIENRLKSLTGVKRAEVAGSVRRWKETVGDADFLVISEEPENVMNFFVSMPEVVNVYSKGKTRSSVKLNNGMEADLRVISSKSYGAALQYFTGNTQHNVELRRLAIKRGWKLNEYGIFKGGTQIAGGTEEEIYDKLGLQWIPPELRENTGEIEAAAGRKLPNLIGYDDLRGDFQVTTNWTDGSNSIAEIAEEAKAIGLEYIALGDHTKSLAMTGGLDEKGISKQGREIEKLNKSISGLTILKGTEVNIMKDGSLDIKDSTLAELDVVGAGIHSYFNLPKEEQTRRIIRAMENENVDLIVHPTGRQIKTREPIQLDIEKVIEAAKATGTILEIDAMPDRLDLKDEYVRKCVEASVKLAIDSDAHSKLQLHNLKFGIATARRGWATAKDIVNTRTLKELRDYLK
ncbi:MAG: DNA polymerase/3'-5' exonuclease PolX [Methanobacteriota archaeon]